ncbi:MAG: flagellar basal-body rod protein FlgG [Epsilonproteobacteria bacterium]|nr:flagellar basal-body rod protein FlgG [Campylobacterota bacterium]OIO13181.1 MAG: flagellar basal-body rod protein FlgG [Helicobacteraceae bacterium CG1_02_36_14]PIP09392.1 MAG: flagellar basal-body rod protein FlgG [Sulfurimonas sp. CG23_combo_of_CG06-09_8_20_14_all_36_33]PIS26054.1 MAG: flagellar basal-body rod protein FlgG [Sulfurimonas sp. CG08_land_8_20_14_0_20_36_33]PIU35319.1 MAG: flagellar basal-body rod protein FlgG [Sulfurimonas sp. CG07_land_8_20_14_0_80_36_56]PIV02857.1 MAG: fla
MIQSLYTASTGMLGMQSQINVTANNIANVNTIGFKKSRAEFADLMYNVMEYAGTSTSDVTKSPTGIEIGLGSRPTAVNKVFSEGSLKQTDNQLDVAITGRGFFQLELPDGTPVYSRNGAFKVDSNGTVVNGDGYTLIPQIVVPPDATNVTIGTDGTVTVVQSGQTQATQIGQITTTNFINPAGLHSMGDNLYVETDSSGQPVQGTPGLNGLGVLRQGFVELSNVELVVELTDLITAQRAYDSNSKVITTSDEMLQTTNNLKR